MTIILLYIQSLWHLRGFRDELLKTASRHKHVGDPGAVSCIVCALCHIFTELSKVSKGEGEAVAPTSLRMALSISFPTEKLIRMVYFCLLFIVVSCVHIFIHHFVIRLITLSTNDSFVNLILFDHDQGQMNDASEVVEAILRRMHDSYTYRADYLAESHKRNCSGSWDCANNDCIAHDMFGADVYARMICYNCGLESSQHKYTSFLHNINTCSLNFAMVSCVLLLVYCILYFMVADMQHLGLLFVPWYRGSVQAIHLMIF